MGPEKVKTYLKGREEVAAEREHKGWRRSISWSEDVVGTSNRYSY